MPTRIEVEKNNNIFTPYFPRGFYRSEAILDLPQKYYSEIKLLSSSPHWLEVGKTGSGKGIKMSSLVEEAFDAGYKVISIYNAGREIEHGFKRYPATKRFQKIISERGQIPRSFPVQIYTPACKGTTPDKLPDFFNLYTVPVSNYPTINAELLSIVNMVGFTDIAKIAINDTLASLNDDDNVADLYLALEKLIEGGYQVYGMDFDIVKERTRPSLHRILLAAIKTLFMSQASYEYALTNEKFIEILNNRDEISVFTQAFAPLPLHPFFSLLPLQYIFQNSTHSKHPVLLVATEIQKIMQAKVSAANPANKLFSDWMIELVRGARKYNIHFVGDTQIYSTINPEFRSQASVMAFYSDIEDDKGLKDFGRKLRDKDRIKMLPDILHFLKHDPYNGVFEYYNFDKNRVYMVKLPTTAHPWEGNRGDFLWYVKKYDKECKWIPTNFIFDEVEEDIKDSTEEVKDYIKGRKDKPAKRLKEMITDDEIMVE